MGAPADLQTTDGSGGPVEDARFVVFTLGGYEYGLPADSVNEVIRFVAVTPVPESPRWVLGVIDLRGRTIPVVDGRRRLGLPDREDWLGAAIVVVESGGVVSGLVVDTAVDMTTVGIQTLEAAPEVPSVPAVAAASRVAVSVVVRVGERLILVLDPSVANPEGEPEP
ncbi:MAG TPA: chemotaxis protein CheW [Actinomycetota bacterium]|nr:chemotaxis protein CheW [Actinomycetota bacterium]